MKKLILLFPFFVFPVYAAERQVRTVNRPSVKGEVVRSETRITQNSEPTLTLSPNPTSLPKVILRNPQIIASPTTTIIKPSVTVSPTSIPIKTTVHKELRKPTSIESIKHWVHSVLPFLF